MGVIGGYGWWLWSLVVVDWKCSVGVVSEYGQLGFNWDVVRGCGQKLWSVGVCPVVAVTEGGQWHVVSQ